MAERTPGSNPADRRYTTEHEWIKADGEHYVVGITAFAQETDDAIARGEDRSRNKAGVINRVERETG